ncbi:MAG: 50S ribosomal protein L1 [candidate division WS2 bacterium ADurb.Bin280]|uniref:Ribosomal protein n=1 Tax=candidate division WS2 bacterium ADurb.Bin280 TaxID=1852829 RepID=A0A1V5SET8_9BACT|nr:MAG: 50S ribosomal protein L1 [candidate division WS2 bacterium ADurb.Bin280]
MAKKKQENPVVEVEKQEIETDEIDKASSAQESEIGQEVDLETAEVQTQTKEKIAPEVAAINTDNQTAQEITQKTKKQVKKKKVEKKKQRSKSYLKSLEGGEFGKLYKIDEAVELIKKHSYAKFDATVNLAIRLQKSKKGDDAVRGTIKLPHGAGRTLKVAIADEKIIEEVKKGKTDFDILVASTQMMPKLGVVAKVLGPKGKMPNPKDGTVVDDPKSVVEDLSKNVVRYRQDLGANIHLPVGKVSFESKKLAENIQAVLKALSHLKKESVTISPTMGPGIKIDF